MLVRARELKEVRLIIVFKFFIYYNKTKIKDILFNLLAIKYIK